jgi:excisionase family DNA binding protein
MRKYLSTQEVCAEAKIGLSTLQRWIAGGKLRVPRMVEIGKGRFRQWTDADVRRVLRYKKALKKGRPPGRKA